MKYICLVFGIYTLLFPFGIMWWMITADREFDNGQLALLACMGAASWICSFFYIRGFRMSKEPENGYSEHIINDKNKAHEN